MEAVMIGRTPMAQLLIVPIMLGSVRFATGGSSASHHPELQLEFRRRLETLRPGHWEQEVNNQYAE
eukprot:3732717-Pyramimonas_sp.AAC.1